MGASQGGPNSSRWHSRGMVVLKILTIPLVLACSDILGLDLPNGSIELVPIPAEYEQWWTLTQRCSGLHRDFSKVRWYTTPGAKTIQDRDDARGIYIRGRGQIVLADGQERDGYLVRHEMLHALHGSGGHPRRLFLEQCGGIVSCGETCQSEAGGSPTWDLTSPLLPVSAAEVGVELLPSVVSQGTGTRGCVTIVVSTENPSPRRVTLDVRRGDALSWGIAGIGGGSGGGPLLKDSLVVIDSGKEWSYAFDCPRRVEEGLALGDYAVFSRLEYVQSKSVVLRIVP